MAAEFNADWLGYGLALNASGWDPAAAAAAISTFMERSQYRAEVILLSKADIHWKKLSQGVMQHLLHRICPPSI